MSEINYRRNGKKYGRECRFTERLELPRDWQKKRKRGFNRKARRIMNRDVGIVIKVSVIADPWVDSRW